MGAKAIFWFRRDLRLHDNSGLYHALRSGHTVKPVFIFDKHILDHLDEDDARVTFIYDRLRALDTQLRDFGSGISVYYGDPVDVWSRLLKSETITEVYCNKDYEPYAKDRDATVKSLCQQREVSFYSFKDHVIFDEGEVTKKDGNPYTVFTPYKKAWLSKLEEGCRHPLDTSYYLKSYPSESLGDNFSTEEAIFDIELEDMGFERSGLDFPSMIVSQKTIKTYDVNRDFPWMDGTSMLGLHFRFGTISIREKARKAQRLNATYLSELIWRDFYSNILNHFPYVIKGPFKEKYATIPWQNNDEDFKAWCAGLTGYPIVDAGMRELNATGYIHNRVRMITASFLTKHLLIDWRWGEAYFAKKLLDFDLASNNGGWQWAAGCGTDAAPYFRIFNPYTQADKFDKDRMYIKKWIPEYGTDQYPKEIVEHKYARQRCLEAYKVGFR